jgi:hypothetical protein
VTEILKYLYAILLFKKVFVFDTFVYVKSIFSRYFHLKKYLFAILLFKKVFVCDTFIKKCLFGILLFKKVFFDTLV